MVCQKLFNQIIFFSFIYFCLFSDNSYGQQSTTRFAAEYSDIFELLAQKKSANPKIKPEELTAAVNELLAQKGLNYEFELAADICSVVAERRKLKSGQPGKRRDRIRQSNRCRNLRSADRNQKQCRTVQVFIVRDKGREKSFEI